MSVATSDTEHINTADTADEFKHVDPGTLVIGTNVRTDTRPDANDFAASIRNRGVLEAITAYRDAEQRLVVLRGQRRAVVATKVGTPTGTVPVRIVPSPEIADRIVDQISENVHRQDMHEKELRDGIEQLALVGVTAAQMTKRLAVPRHTVDAALKVVKNPASKERMDTESLSLEDAAIYAEFEDDPDALTRLVSRRTWQPLVHLAQELRDERTERKAVVAEVKRLRQQGVPALAPADVPEDADYLALRGLRDEHGQAVPCEHWPALAGAAVVVEAQWFAAEGEDGDGDEDEDGHADHASTKAGGPGVVAGSDGSVLRLSQVWICTDPAAAGLHHPRWSPYTAASPRVASEPINEDDNEAVASAEAAREAAEAAARAERRRVLVNNKAWRSSTTVRRDWLRLFAFRRAAPSGAEALIAAAVIGCQPSLGQAFTSRHSLLREWRPAAADDPHPGWDSSACQRLIDTAKTPKTTTMLTLAAVLAAWEDAATEWTWRKPSAWDGTVMHALTGWGYQASEVERLLIEPDAHQVTDDTDDTKDTGHGDADGTERGGVPDEEADEPAGDDVHTEAGTDTADARVPVAE